MDAVPILFLKKSLQPKTNAYPSIGRSVFTHGSRSDGEDLERAVAMSELQKQLRKHNAQSCHVCQQPWQNVSDRTYIHGGRGAGNGQDAQSSYQMSYQGQAAAWLQYWRQAPAPAPVQGLDTSTEESRPQTEVTQNRTRSITQANFSSPAAVDGASYRSHDADAADAADDAYLSPVPALSATPTTGESMDDYATTGGQSPCPGKWDARAGLPDLLPNGQAAPILAHGLQRLQCRSPCLPDLSRTAIGKFLADAVQLWQAYATQFQEQERGLQEHVATTRATLLSAKADLESAKLNAGDVQEIATDDEDGDTGPSSANGVAVSKDLLKAKAWKLCAKRLWFWWRKRSMLRSVQGDPRRCPHAARHRQHRRRSATFWQGWLSATLMCFNREPLPPRDFQLEHGIHCMKWSYCILQEPDTFAVRVHPTLANTTACCSAHASSDRRVQELSDDPGAPFQALYAAWTATAFTWDEEAPSRTVTTWFVDHHWVQPHCKDDLRQPGTHLEFHRVPPLPPHQEAVTAAHLILIQRPRDDWVTSLLTAVDSQMCTMIRLQMRVTTHEWILADNLLPATGLDRQCTGPVKAFTCDVWYDAQPLVLGRPIPGRSGFGIVVQLQSSSTTCTRSTMSLQLSHHNHRAPLRSDSRMPLQKDLGLHVPSLSIENPVEGTGRERTMDLSLNVLMVNFFYQHLTYHRALIVPGLMFGGTVHHQSPTFGPTMMDLTDRLGLEQLL
eukprot:s156_g24.t1